jgi:hypothetical protein
MKAILYKTFVVSFCVVMALIGVLILYILSLLTPGFMGFNGQFGESRFPKKPNYGPFSGMEFVIGNLGGVPVRIPHHFATHIVYDDDPEFGERRKGPVPTRTYQSKFNSYGFQVRFPDMAGWSTKELHLDFAKYLDSTWEHFYDYEKHTSPWMTVSITAGRRYHGPGMVDAYANYLISFDAEKKGLPALAYENHVKLPKPKWGLTEYLTPGNDPKTGKPYRNDWNTKDLFVHRNASGKVQTLIQCGARNFPGKPYSLCTQGFTLEPSMHVQVDVYYNSNFLPHWKEIQQNVTQLMRSFEVDGTALPASAPASAPARS